MPAADDAAAHLARIAEVDAAGPALTAVIVANPEAPAAAAATRPSSPGCARRAASCSARPTSASGPTSPRPAAPRYDSSIGAGSHAAIAGHPHLSVPMGAVEGLPVGLSIIGAQWDDAAVLRAGATYERVRQRA